MKKLFAVMVFLLNLLLISCAISPHNFSPAWSSDGNKIVFVSDRDGNNEIYLIDLDDPQGSTELTYRVLVDENTKDVDRVVKKVIDELKVRAYSCGLKEPAFYRHGATQIIIKLSGVDKEMLKKYKDLLKVYGSLELKEVGNEVLHKKYPAKLSATDKPAGYVLMKNSDKVGDRDYLKEEYLWVKETPIVTEEHISHANAVCATYGFEIAFTLNSEGAKLFKEVTKRLAQKGYIAVILDGEIKSHPFVASSIEDGEGIITGRFTEEEAQKFATILCLGRLPALVGRIASDCTFVIGEPEAENTIRPILDKNLLGRSFSKIAINSSDVKRLTNNKADDKSPVWLPDGRIAFISNRDGDYEIYVMDEDGSNVKRLRKTEVDSK